MRGLQLTAQDIMAAVQCNESKNRKSYLDDAGRLPFEEYPAG